VNDGIPDSHRWPVVARQLRGDADDHLLAPLQICAEPLGLEEVTSRSVREAVVLQSVPGPVESGGQLRITLDALSNAEERRPGAFLREHLGDPRRVFRVGTVVEGESDGRPISGASPQYRTEQHRPGMKEPPADSHEPRSEQTEDTSGDCRLRRHAAGP
jgi:hypothetical protein